MRLDPRVPIVSVLVPTHDHGATLLHAVRSALAQTVEDLEVLIVGDGPSPATEEAAQLLALEDARVRYLPFPKGERHGEAHRHAALQTAQGRAVLYLSDDDLWLDDHAETLLELLDAGADFAHTLSTCILPAGTVRAWTAELGREWYRSLLLSGRNRVTLSAAGHTMELYRRLPSGWKPAPEGLWTDLHMWQQILGMPDARAASSHRATVLHLPSPFRRDLDHDARVEELGLWSAQLGDPHLRRALHEALLVHQSEQIAALETGAEATNSARAPTQLAEPERRDRAKTVSVLRRAETLSGRVPAREVPAAPTGPADLRALVVARDDLRLGILAAAETAPVAPWWTRAALAASGAHLLLVELAALDGQPNSGWTPGRATELAAGARALGLPTVLVAEDSDALEDAPDALPDAFDHVVVLSRAAASDPSSPLAGLTSTIALGDLVTSG